jgi:hypothetical protein
MLVLSNRIALASNSFELALYLAFGINSAIMLAQYRTMYRAVMTVLGILSFMLFAGIFFLSLVPIMDIPTTHIARVGSSFPYFAPVFVDLELKGPSLAFWLLFVNVIWYSFMAIRFALIGEKTHSDASQQPS